MKTDTLTGPNLSYRVAVLEKKENPHIHIDDCYIEMSDFRAVIFDYADPATFQPIAERELIGVHYVKCEVTGNITWRASTDKKSIQDNERYQRYVVAFGSTMAEAMMRCYVKSYLGEDTKGE